LNQDFLAGSEDFDGTTLASGIGTVTFCTVGG
jgi:hypothetical protein